MSGKFGESEDEDESHVNDRQITDLSLKQVLVGGLRESGGRN